MPPLPRFLTALLLGAAASLTAAPARPPNLIVILTDDQGYHDVGFNGCQDIPTPNIDSIAQQGVRFSSGYTTYAVCSPSRAGLLTGRYGQRFGFERNPQWEPDNPVSGLPLSETTLADTLGQVGYHSGIIGKWHLGAHPTLHPLQRGFDEFFGFLVGSHSYFPEDLTFQQTADAKTIEQSRRLWILRDHQPVKTTQYLTDEFSDEAVRFVARHQDSPFFLYLSYNAPHAPLQAPEKYLSRFPDIADRKRRTYAAMVSAVDDGVGRVLAELRKQGIEENTLVFFLSDNGGPQSNGSDNAPLRGEKGSPWEGGFRVPFAAQWPGHLPAGLVYDSPVSALDIFATITAQAHAPTHPERPLDGVNLLPYVVGAETTAPHDAIYLRMFDRGAFAVRSGDYKLLISGHDRAPELFDLTSDIGESADLAADNPAILAALEQRRLDWTRQLTDPVFEGLMQMNAKKNKKQH